MQDDENNYLMKPSKAKKIDAAGSKITYGKENGIEYFHIPGPIDQRLRFVVRSSVNKTNSFM